jgi:monothiol glutaredoxin
MWFCGTIRGLNHGVASACHKRRCPNSPLVLPSLKGYLHIKQINGRCPAAKELIMSAINAWIDNEVKSNDVVLFMKGTPGFPQCGFSGQVVQILDHVGVDYKGINVLTNDELRNGIKDYASWPTIPQLYVKGEFVGGCDIVREMFQSQELQDFLAEKGVAIKGAA